MIKRLLLLTLVSACSIMSWGQKQIFLYQEVTDPIATLATNGTMVAMTCENNILGFTNADNQASYFAVNTTDPAVYGVYFTFEATGTSGEYYIKVRHLDGTVMAGPWDSASDPNNGYMNECDGWTTNVTQKLNSDNSTRNSAIWTITKDDNGYYLKSKSRGSYLCPGGKNEYHSTYLGKYAWRFYTLKAGIDMTSSVPNACCYEYDNGQTMTSGGSQVKKTPDNWSISWAGGSDKVEFTTNNWSTEGDNDGSNMKNPFVQVWNGSNAAIPNCTIDHTPVTNLPAGEYRLSIFARSLNKDTDYKCSGTEIYVNSSSVRLSSGKQCKTSDSNKSGKFNHYGIVFNLAEGENLNFGFRLSGANYYFLTYKDVQLTYFPAEGDVTALVASAKAQAIDASSLLSQKQGAAELAALQNAINAINDLDASLDTEETVNAAIAALETAVADSEESIDFYAAVNNEIASCTSKSATFDEDGQDAFDISAITSAYEAGTLADTALADLKNALAAAAKAQTTPMSDMTSAIINASCAEYQGIAQPANISSSAALHVAPDAWTLTYTGEAGNSNVQFCINNWSTEGNSDGSNMKNPYVQYWNGNSDNPALPQANIAHDTVTGLPAGEYTISILGRTLNKDANYRCSGTVFYANGQEVRFSSGKQCNYSNESKTGKYDVYTLNFTLEEGQDLNFGIEVGSGIDYYFLSFKDVSLTYWGDSKDEFVEIPQSVSDGDPATKEVNSGYTQYSGGEINVAIKVLNVDVTGADYVTIKFAEPVNSSIWKVAYNGVQGTEAWNDIPSGATEFVIPIEGTQYAETGILPEITLMTAWGTVTPIKVKGVYKHMMPSVTMTVSASAQYGTFVAPFDVTIPEGVEAYGCFSIENDVLVLSALNGSIPANTPVILYAEEGINQTFYGNGTPYGETVTSGYLTGVFADTQAPVDSYVLQNHNGVVKFYIVDETDYQPTVKANRCYLTLPEATVKSIGFSIADAIANVNVDKTSDGSIYNLAGQKVDSTFKGIVIKNGKKFMNK